MISDVSLTLDGAHAAFVYQTAEMPPEVYVAPLRDFRENRISAIHHDVPRPAMGATELLSWKSRDGLGIEGLLTYPVGYAILRPNPRGSTGYGKDFRFANVRDWGQGDYEDLMSGVDHVIELGIADPDASSAESVGGFRPRKRVSVGGTPFFPSGRGRL